MDSPTSVLMNSTLAPLSSSSASRPNWNSNMTPTASRRVAASEKQPFGTLARLLWGAFLEAALRLAHTDEPEATKQEMLLGLEQLIAGLRVKH